jgi:hypothetical protein
MLHILCFEIKLSYGRLTGMALEHTDTLRSEIILNTYTINTYVAHEKKTVKGISSCH